MSEEEIPIEYYLTKNGEVIKFVRYEKLDKYKIVLNKIKEYINEHIKYECDNAFNGMQFYSYHLYDFNKEELLKLLEEIE